jgi:hypothetical protein
MNGTTTNLTPEQQAQNDSAMKAFNTQGGSVKIPTVVPVENLNTPVTNINPIQPQINTTGLRAGIANATGYNTAALQQTEADAQAQEKAYQDSLNFQNSDIGRLISSVGGRGNELVNQYNQVDSTGNSVNALAGRLRTLNAQSQNLATQNTLIPVQIQQDAANTGATDRGIAPNQAGQLRNNLIQQATIAQQAAIAKADYDTAKSFADQVVDAKYEQVLADIEAKKTNLSNIRENLTAAQKKTADATTRRLNKEQADAEAKVADEKAQQKMLIDASSQGAPADLLNRAKQAKTPSDVAAVLGMYAGDYWGTKAKIAAYNNSVTKNSGGSGSLSSSSVDGASSPLTSAAQSYLEQYNSGELTLKELYSQIPAAESGLQNEVARLVAAQGGKRVLKMDDAQLSAIDDQIKNIDDLLKGDVGSIVGFVRGGLGIIPDSKNVYKQSALAIANNLVANQTLQSLADAKNKGITFGALSEAELAAVASAASRVASKAIMDKETGKISNFTGLQSDFINDLKLIKEKLQASKVQKANSQPTGVSGQIDTAVKILNNTSTTTPVGLKFY